MPYLHEAGDGSGGYIRDVVFDGFTGAIWPRLPDGLVCVSMHQSTIMLVPDRRKIKRVRRKAAQRGVEMTEQQAIDAIFNAPHR